VRELSRWCGRCGTELRSGARFCSKCGQRVIEQTTLADDLLGPAAPPEPGPADGPGFTEVAVVRALPPITPPTVYPSATLPAGPDHQPGNEWSEWYEPGEARRPYPAPPLPAGAYQPYQPQPYQLQPYQPPYQPPTVYPGYQQPYRSPFEPGPRRPGSGDRQSRTPLFWSVLSAAVAVAVLVLVLVFHPFGDDHETVSDAANATSTPIPTTSAAAATSPRARASASATASGAASPTGSASASSSSSSAAAQRQAASAVATMLAGSVTDRTAIDGAYNDVDSCGPNLDNDAAVFARAVSSRRALLVSLAALPGRSALPPALLTDLTGAWQASIAADQDLATWAGDEVSQGCRAGDTGNAGYRAALGPDDVASADKAAFVTQWNPIAASDGLTGYQSSQL
jgi:zinc-ribbon domain